MEFNWFHCCFLLVWVLFWMFYEANTFMNQQQLVLIGSSPKQDLWMEEQSLPFLTKFWIWVSLWFWTSLDHV